MLIKPNKNMFSIIQSFFKNARKIKIILSCLLKASIYDGLVSYPGSESELGLTQKELKAQCSGADTWTPCEGQGSRWSRRALIEE